MNPILLYPQNEAQAKFFSESAEKQGVGFMPISEKIWERFDEILFAEELVEIRRNHVPVSEKKIKDLFDRKLGRK